MTHRFTLKLWGRVLDRLGLIPGEEEAPGGSDSSGGLELIDSGTITAPVEYLDLDLPSGYSGFLLKFYGFQMSNSDFIAGALSADGGASWLYDAENNDVYSTKSLLHSAAAGTLSGGVESTDLILISGIDVDPSAEPGYPISLNAEIFPGAAGVTPIIFTEIQASADGNNNAAQQCWTSGYLNSFSTVPPVLQRINALRILPAGNFDVDPPTSGRTIVSGSYFLYGVPTP